MACRMKSGGCKTVMRTGRKEVPGRREASSVLLVRVEGEIDGGIKKPLGREPE